MIRIIKPTFRPTPPEQIPECSGVLTNEEILREENYTKKEKELGIDINDIYVFDGVNDSDFEDLEDWLNSTEDNEDDYSGYYDEYPDDLFDKVRYCKCQEEASRYIYNDKEVPEDLRKYLLEIKAIREKYDAERQE